MQSTVQKDSGQIASRSNRSGLRWARLGEDVLKHHLGRLLFILRHSPSEAVEFLIGLQSLLWGVWVSFYPTESLTASAYHSMLFLAPEWIWGILTIGLGSIKIWTVTDGNCYIRRWGLVASFLIWLFIAISVFLDNPASPRFVIYMLISLASIWCYWRFGSRD